MRYLAIDYGNKRTGLATCDRSETICSPLAVIPTNSELINKIIGVIKNENIEAVIIGLPINMDDSKGKQAEITTQFANQLKKQIDIQIHFQDERLSTFEAHERIASAEFTRKKKKKRIDAIAAANILEAFLENKNQLP